MRGVGAVAAGSRTRARVVEGPAIPRGRAAFLFGGLALLFAVLAGRSLYLQWFDNAFLQERGAARYSRELELPAHRGRIVDRNGEPLAVSTPVKSLWAFPGQLELSPEDLARLARVLDVKPAVLKARIDASDEFAYVAKLVSPTYSGASESAPSAS